jgi:crossover junction endodeoxyribonuclease RusA
VEPFEFFVEGPALSQQTRNPSRLREWKEYIRNEAAKFWHAPGPLQGTLKLTVVYYHERPSVLIDHDNMIKPIQDALAGLVFMNDRQITDAQTRKTNIDGRFRLRHLSPVYARAFAGGKEFVYIRIEEAPGHRNCYDIFGSAGLQARPRRTDCRRLSCQGIRG